MTHRLQATVPDELYDRVDCACGATGEPMADFVRRAVRDQLTVDEHNRALGINLVIDEEGRRVWVQRPVRRGGA